MPTTGTTTPARRERGLPPEPDAGYRERILFQVQLPQGWDEMTEPEKLTWCDKLVQGTLPPSGEPVHPAPDEPTDRGVGDER